MSQRRSNKGRWIALIATSLVVGGVNSLVACGSDDDVTTASDSGADQHAESDGSVGAGDSSVIFDGGSDAACVGTDPDAAIDCTGKCGPVSDPCSGKTAECGGCANAVTEDGGDGGRQACDLATNTCGKPKITCNDLGAECGVVKNSCGVYLDCPSCPLGKECDPDSHKCRECQAVTCGDLGFECGSAYLGCGPDQADNRTECGACPDKGGAPQRCNTTIHKCEPSCTPKSRLELCNAAKAARGVECGAISDDCGGIVVCDNSVDPAFGCKVGQACGIQGLDNRCDPATTSDECIAAGQNCGTIVSACTGATINCGTCATGKVCNANGVCGDPCSPKTCDDFKGFECGKFDDGCGKTLNCGSCANGVCDLPTNTCCNTNKCNVTYLNECGTKLANGCGQNNLDCSCTTGSCTTDGHATPAPPAGTTGSCCIPKVAGDYPGQCGTKLPNGCGQNTINISCSGGQVCVNNQTHSPGTKPPDGVAGTCCTRTDTCNQAGNGCAPVDNSCLPGNPVSCNGNCTVAGSSCNANVCCKAAATCTGNGAENAECNITHTPVDVGCGGSRTCDCAGGRTCWCGDHVCTAADGAGQCKTAFTCQTTVPGYKDHCGTSLNNGIGGSFTCPCPAGQACSQTASNVIGVCQCNNPTHAKYTCLNVPNGPGTPGADACGDFNDGCGGTLPCPCQGGLSCNKTPNPNVCCQGAVCPTQALGSACGSVSNGCTTVQCGCPSGVGNENFRCVTNTCQCVPSGCGGRVGLNLPDGCGGTIDNCGG